MGQKMALSKEKRDICMYFLNTVIFLLVFSYTCIFVGFCLQKIVLILPMYECSVVFKGLLTYIFGLVARDIHAYIISAIFLV